MIDRQRFASIFGISVLILSLVAFGVPAPTIVQDGTPETDGAGVDGIHPSYGIELQSTDPMMTQDARALACGGVCVAGAIALTAGTAGTIIGKEYFSGASGDQATVYYSAQSLKDRMKTDYSALNSSLESTRTMTYRVAETSFAESMANNSTKAEAQAFAEEEVEDYLSGVLNDEIYRRNNAYMSAAHKFHSTEGATFYLQQATGDTAHELVEQNVTLPNGNTTTELHSDGRSLLGTTDPGETTLTTDSSDYGNVNFNSIPKDGFRKLKEDYVAIEDEVDAEISNFTDSVSESQYENLSPDDIASPVNQALEWGQSYEDTGSSGYAAALMSSLGYATNGTGTQYQISLPNGTTYNGTWYGDEQAIPNGTLEAGGTYNGSGDVSYLATDGGQTIPLDGSYTVDQITTRDGETLNETKLSTWSRDSLNTSAPLTTLEKWQQLQENVSDGGDGLFGGFLGGDGFLPFVPGGSLVHLLILVGGGFLLLGGSRGGGGGTIVMGGGGQ